MKVKFCRVDEPEARMFPNVPRPELLWVVENKVVANKLVVVAWVPVAFTKVKFWRVVEPVTKRLERVVRPLVAESVPGKT